MKFDVLYNFISPVTGRVLCDPTYVLMGDSRGIAIPSPILSNILDASFVIGFPNASLPNAQVLNAFADGYIFNTAGIISTTPTVIPFLTDKRLWIGNATNTPTEYSTIFLENLPPLGLTDFPDPSPSGFVGEYYEGTASGVPEASSRVGGMFDDILLINARFFGARFVLNDGNALLRKSMPFSQFLADLAPGGIAKVEATGQISIAVAGTDYLDVGGAPPGDGVIPILEFGPYPPNPKLIYPSTIHIIGTDDVIGINSLSGNIISAKNAVTSDDIIVSKNNVQTKMVQLFDYTPAFVNYVALKAPPVLFNNIEWTMPDQQGTAGQVLTNTDGSVLAFNNILPDGLDDNLLAQGRDGFNNPIIVNAVLANKNIFIGDATNTPVARPNITLNNLPDLTSNKVWKGNGFNRPEETDIETGNVSGPEPAFSIEGNVVIWDGESGRKIKDSEFSIADLETLAEEAAASAEEAAASETAAGLSETAAAASETAAAASEAAAAASAEVATGAAGVATAASIAAALSALSASSSASDASGYADDASSSANSSAGSAAASLAHLNTLLTTNLTLTGDVTASNLIKNPIVTTFAPNPIFTGTGSLTFPAGTTAERPTIPTFGMGRCNITLQNFEIYNGISWLSMGTGNGSVTSITAGTGLTGGVITNSGTIDLANTAVVAGSYTNTSLTVDAQGRLIAASSGVDPVISVLGTATRISSTGGQNPIIDLINTTVTPATYTNTTLTVDDTGRLTAASSGFVGIMAALYMSGNATGTLLVAGTFTKVLGTTTSSFLNSNFTMSDNNQLQYNGIDPINTTVTTNISVNHPIVLGSTIGVSIYKNGNPLVTGAAENYAFQLTPNSATSLSVSLYVPFVTNDYVEVFVSADSDTTVVVTDMNFLVST